MTTSRPLPAVPIAHVCLSGEIDMASAPAIVDAAIDASSAGAGALVLDLARVSFMDSQGLKALVQAHVELERVGAELVLVGVPPGVARMLALAGLDRLLSVR